jgi:hypothetical protein
LVESTSCMNETRARYGFSNEGRQLVHERAGIKCEFPGEECLSPNNGIVHHITGCSEARLDDKSQESIRDVTMNALMLCDDHAFDHDEQEGLQIFYLKLERERVIPHRIYQRD